jgi:hypothetical protein
MGRRGTVQRSYLVTQPTLPAATPRGAYRAWLIRQLEKDLAIPSGAFVDYFGCKTGR